MKNLKNNDKKLEMKSAIRLSFIFIFVTIVNNTIAMQQRIITEEEVRFVTPILRKMACIRGIICTCRNNENKCRYWNEYLNFFAEQEAHNHQGRPAWRQGNSLSF